MKFKDYKKKMVDTGEMTEAEVGTMELISTLEAFRRENNITQTELATRIGMTQPQIAKIENFDRVPNLTTIIKIANGLGYSLVFVKDEKDSKKLVGSK